ncbi:MAG TPA: sigma-54 dependent transcriptional regulator [Bacteroidales bacterium]|nr:sigma-54 dependent transcriptional regulator [Bacteroidales bacterium]HPT09074.1 sigma-54 dependent transcriptional regulator [Bacteroidales bacterium]
MEIQSIKQRFGIIGNSTLLDRAIDIARQVAATDITVLVSGESGTGKEFFPKIIHQLSARKHGAYIAVNCGAIPEGTIDSELFGHEKGSFTGAHETRKGYFEVVDGGTIFLDEVAELPMGTQVRLLRVLESGEFIRVGSSKVLKTNVRVVAATNVNIPEAIAQGKFRQDLFYRLNTVPILVPALRERKEDIYLLFRKFASDAAEKYRMPPVQLEEDARQAITNYRWPGNIRQLKNLTEQVSIIEKTRNIDAATILKYLPAGPSTELPVLYKGDDAGKFNERELLYKVLFDMKKDMNDLKQLVMNLMQNENTLTDNLGESNHLIKRLYKDFTEVKDPSQPMIVHETNPHLTVREPVQEPEEIEENLSLQRKERDFIQRALNKYEGKRKDAARELGISERTLYRKIKEYDLE